MKCDTQCPVVLYFLIILFKSSKCVWNLRNKINHIKSNVPSVFFYYWNDVNILVLRGTAVWMWPLGGSEHKAVFNRRGRPIVTRMLMWHSMSLIRFHLWVGVGILVRLWTSPTHETTWCLLSRCRLTLRIHFCRGVWHTPTKAPKFCVCLCWSVVMFQEGCQAAAVKSTAETR